MTGCCAVGSSLELEGHPKATHPLSLALSGMLKLHGSRSRPRVRWPLAVSFPALSLAATVAMASGTPAASFEADGAAARAALTRGDYARALAGYRALLRISPDYPAILLGIAHSEVGLGNPLAALASFRRVVAMGLGGPLLGDCGFASLRGQPGYQRLLDAARRQSRPIIIATKAFELPEPRLIPEGLAYDAVGRRFFISSTYLRKIAVRDRQGRVRDFATASRSGFWQVLGLKIDSRRGWLLACSGADGPEMLDFRQSDLGKSGLFILDLESGRLLRRYEVATPGMHLFNDLVASDDGDVFITDSDEGSVYRLDPDQQRLRRLTPPGRLLYPNGIALSGDGNHLYVAEEEVGIARVDVRTGGIRRLPHPPDITTAGIDGLYLHGRDLIATQTDVHPNRIVAFRLSPTGDAIVSAKTLERGDPRMSSPTEGVVAGDTLYFIANSQQGSFDAAGRIWPDSRLTNTVVLQLALPAG